MFLIYILIGALSGTLAGMLGIGGGIIVVPALAAVFLSFNLMPASYVMHMAIGTSLAVIIITLTSALRAHSLRGNVRTDFVKVLLPGLLLGAVLGALIAHQLPSYYLRIFFALFLIFLSGRLLIAKHKEETRDVPGRYVIASVATGLGAITSILGAGGGLLMVPFMLRCKLSMHQAAGTSVACGVGTALVATLSYVFLNMQDSGIAYSTGYIYWPAFFGVAVASMLFAPIGTALGHRLPTAVLRRVLGIFLLLVALDMLFTH
ncbi:MAG: sulfite exporter TauE/SafE family protein [Gammaproteobacteria bacterium]|nr:sulfite exporter TauE/SafE family protein [Gammaproteobacteria bacterium]